MANRRYVIYASFSTYIKKIYLFRHQLRPNMTYVLCANFKDSQQFWGCRNDYFQRFIFC